jgi:hypothetical protein
VRRVLVLLLLGALIEVPAAAQSSQFGVRGLGHPGRGLSARALGSAGAFGLFDGESSLNPAALDAISTVTAAFTGVQTFRTVDNPAGSESLRESRFPLLVFAGPVRRFPLALGVSYSAYAGRDFTVAATNTLVIRDVPEPVFDTLTSRGGISDLRLAGSYRLSPGWAVGGSFHVLTGSNRLRFRRRFENDAYVPVNQQAELSYAGIGASLGTIWQLGSSLSMAAMARSDGDLGVDLDSVRVSDMDLPYSFGLGLRYRVGTRLELATQGVLRTWSGANSDLLEAGAPGAKNTVDVSFGGEYVGDPRRPFRRPLRFGARYGTLPFPLDTGEQPSEFAVSLGSGARFAQQRGGVDIAVEHVWRSAEDLKERGFVVTVGVTVRP